LTDDGSSSTPPGFGAWDYRVRNALSYVIADILSFNLVLDDSTAGPLSRGLHSNLPPYGYVAEVGEILRTSVDEMFRLVDVVKLDRIGEDRASVWEPL
jgi:hypothetical protein